VYNLCEVLVLILNEIVQSADKIRLEQGIVNYGLTKQVFYLVEIAWLFN